MPPDGEMPDALSGHVVVGRLTLPRIVLDVVEPVAGERGLTALQMVREIVAEWAMRQPPRRGPGAGCPAPPAS